MAAQIKKGDASSSWQARTRPYGSGLQVLPPQTAFRFRARQHGCSATRRPSQGDPQGRHQEQGSLAHLSNVAVADANGKATRVGFKTEGDKKVRFAKTTGDVI